MDTQKTIDIDLADFFSVVNTKSELQLFYKEIDHVISQTYQNTSGLDTILSSSVSSEKKQKILALLQSSAVDLNDVVQVQKKLELIKEVGEVLPVVSVLLAFDPSEEILKKISLWFTRNLGQKVLLDISVERMHLGGSYISFDGKYFDGTLRTKIETLLQSKSYL